MSSSGVGSVEGEPPRKRVRKGTRSCWECKRRKIRCQLSSEDVPVCSGCVARGTTCLSQEYPEERDTSTGNQVGERLGRVERLLETLVSKIESFEEEENMHKIMTPESVGNDVLTPYTTNASANPNVSDNAPFLSLFENSVFGRRDNVVSQATSPVAPTTGSRTPSCRPSKLERIRQALVDLLPSQRDTDLIRTASSSWLLIHALNSQKVEEVSATTFNMQEVSKRHPTSIARSILYIAVCVQQLDPNFDMSRLHLLPSVDARIDKYITTVQSLITSDDDMISTPEGLECLVLQGLFHINAGNPRRAWLTLRRAINLGQLMGIHRKKGASTIRGGRQMWFQAVQADRYLGLLLGLPSGSADLEFEPDETFQNPDVNIDELFNRRLCNIVGRVIERNQSDHPQVYANTQSIDEMMEQLYNEMPAGWWDIPAFIPNDTSLEAAKIFNQIMSQMWSFQVSAFIHLPFMLRAAKERRYEYSRFSCLKASREMIVRYLALRKAGAASFCCNVVDFGALTSTVTLYLVSIMESDTSGESQSQRQQKEADKAMVQAVLKHMEDLSQGGRDLVATQSVSVIKSLLAIGSPGSPSDRQTGNLKLTIPYFGTISIVRPPPVDQNNTSDMSYLQQSRQQSLAMGQELPAQAWQGSYTPRSPGFATQTKMPVISFMSSQFPDLSCQVPFDFEAEPQQPQQMQQQQQQQQIQDWSLPEDNLFFDSLLQTDLEGNWIY